MLQPLAVVVLTSGKSQTVHTVIKELRQFSGFMSKVVCWNPSLWIFLDASSKRLICRFWVSVCVFITFLEIIFSGVFCLYFDVNREKMSQTFSERCNEPGVKLGTCCSFSPVKGYHFVHLNGLHYSVPTNHTTISCSSLLMSMLCLYYRKHHHAGICCSVSQALVLHDKDLVFPSSDNIKQVGAMMKRLLPSFIFKNMCVSVISCCDLRTRACLCLWNRDKCSCLPVFMLACAYMHVLIFKGEVLILCWFKNTNSLNTYNAFILCVE